MLNWWRILVSWYDVMMYRVLVRRLIWHIARLPPTVLVDGDVTADGSTRRAHQIVDDYIPLLVALFDDKVCCMYFWVFVTISVTHGHIDGDVHVRASSTAQHDRLVGLETRRRADGERR